MTSPHDAMAAELRQCKAEVAQLQAKLHCMCGSQIDHSAWEGHSPVSMYDHALDRAETALAAITAEITAARLLAHKGDAAAAVRALQERIGRALALPPHLTSAIGLQAILRGDE